MTSLVEFLSRLTRCSSGSTLVEATIYMPIAISLMVGGADFGMAFSADATVGKSVRDAGRYLGSLSTLPPTAPSVARIACESWAITKAKHLAVYGTLDPVDGETALITGWLTDGGANNNVTVSFDPADCSTPPTIIVSAMAPYTTLMLGAVLPGIGTLTLSAHHEEQPVGE
jgi:Flp pilus assembly protein TadG